MIWIAILSVLVLFVFMGRYLAKDENKYRKELHRNRSVDRELQGQETLEEKISVEVQPKEEPQYNYYSFNVVGMKYCPVSTKKFIDRMTGGETVELVPDPKNRYDKNAIKVMAYDDYKMENVRIGYVPADETLEIRQIMDENPCLDCIIDFVNSDLDDDYFSISVEIKY